MGHLFLDKHTRACAHVSTGTGGVPTEPRAVKTPARESGAGGAISAFQPLSSGFCGLLACSIEFECIHQYINTSTNVLICNGEFINKTIRIIINN